jgi:hypothetical protein
MVRLLNDGLGGGQGVTNDKIRQVGVVQRHRPQEQRLFLSPDPQDIRLLSSTATLGMAATPPPLCTHSKSTSTAHGSQLLCVSIAYVKRGVEQLSPSANGRSGAVPAVIAGGVGTIAVVGAWAWLFPVLRRVDRLTPQT